LKKSPYIEILNIEKDLQKGNHLICKIVPGIAFKNQANVLNLCSCKLHKFLNRFLS